MFFTLFQKSVCIHHLHHNKKSVPLCAPLQTPIRGGADSRIIITATAASFLPHVTSAAAGKFQPPKRRRFFTQSTCGGPTIPPAKVHKYNHACNLFAHASHYFCHKDNLMTTTTVFQSRQHTTADSSIHWQGQEIFLHPNAVAWKQWSFAYLHYQQCRNSSTSTLNCQKV